MNGKIITCWLYIIFLPSTDFENNYIKCIIGQPKTKAGGGRGLLKKPGTSVAPAGPSNSKLSSLSCQSKKYKSHTTFLCQQAARSLALPAFRQLESCRHSVSCYSSPNPMQCHWFCLCFFSSL